MSDPVPKSRRLREAIPAPAPDELPLLNDAEVYTRLRKQFYGQWKKRAAPFCFIGDGYYVSPTTALIAAAVRATLENKPRYVTELYDCDDFAWRLKALMSEHALSTRQPAAYALGVIWRGPRARVGGHAYNWVITTDAGVRQLQMIEPQDGTFRAFDRTVDVEIDLVCG